MAVALPQEPEVEEYVHQEYPRYIYDKEGGSILVKDPDEHAEVVAADPKAYKLFPCGHPEGHPALPKVSKEKVASDNESLKQQAMALENELLKQKIAEMVNQLAAAKAQAATAPPDDGGKGKK